MSCGLRLSDVAVSTPGKEKESEDLQLQLSMTQLSRHNMHSVSLSRLEWIVVRIEVSDTGCGIRQKDMVDSKLFCEI